MSIAPLPAPDETERADAFLLACLRREAPLPDPGCPADLFRDRALHHGLHGVLIAQSGALPAGFRAAIHPEALAFSMWDLRHRGVLVPLLQDLAAAGVRAVLLKGTALAYGLYAAPGQRPRGDTDLLIAPEKRPEAARVLRAHGFRLGSDHNAERMPQEEWELRHEDGSHHTLDLHWNLLRPWALAGLFDTEQLLDQAVPLPGLSPDALTLPPALALLHACVHRASHFSGAYFVGSEVQYGGDRLIWFQDMSLLARSLTTQDWTWFAEAACGSDSADLCLDAMTRAHDLLDAPFPHDIRDQLKSTQGRGQASAYFARSSLLGRIRADMTALPAGQSRFGYLRELVFPPAPVMRAAMPDMAHRPLILLHLQRLRERLHRLHKERRSRKKRQP